VAQRDAELQAAREVSEEMTTRLSVFLAQTERS
jgi:hypothetical protein